MPFFEEVLEIMEKEKLMLQYTSGPWHLRERFLIATDSSGEIASVRGAGLRFNEEATANAQLIVSAPCMRLALMAIRYHVGRIDGFEFCALGMRFSLNRTLDFSPKYFRALQEKINQVIREGL